LKPVKYPEAFIEGLQKFIPNASADEILQAWSAIFTDFFVSIEFLQMLSTKYFFASNTDAIHIETFEQKKFTFL
jgi:putative hydrolase of the HAD superfamily